MKTILIVLFPLFLFAQNPDDLSRTHTDSLPLAFQSKTQAWRSHIYNRISEDLKEGRYDRSTFRFADQSAIQLSYLFSSGRVYSDWMALENYVNQIFKKVIPTELSDNPLVRAYIVKDGYPNAFMTPSGMTFIHTGLLAEINDEATLAGVLAHELAHYYMEHSLKGFVKSEKGDFKERLLSHNHAASKFSVKIVGIASNTIK